MCSCSKVEQECQQRHRMGGGGENLCLQQLCSEMYTVISVITVLKQAIRAEV